MGNCCVTNSHSPPPPPPPPQSHPLLPEKETVKEVLSEAPTLTKSTPPPPIDNRHSKPPPLAGDLEMKPAGVTDFYNSDEFSSDFSQIRKILAENFKNSTAIIKPDRNDDVGRFRRVSPARRARSVGNSPARRLSDPSPVRVGSGSVRDPNRISGSRKENRRSMSPVTRTGPGRIQSVRKTGSGRVRSDMSCRNDNRSKEKLANNELLENPFVSLECFIFL